MQLDKGLIGPARGSASVAVAQLHTLNNRARHKAPAIGAGDVYCEAGGISGGINAPDLVKLHQSLNVCVCNALGAVSAAQSTFYQ